MSSTVFNNIDDGRFLMPRCCVCVPACEQITGLSTVPLSRLVERYRSPPHCPLRLCPSLSASCPPKVLLCLGLLLQLVVPFGCISAVSEKKETVWAENSDRRVKKDNFSALFLSLYPGSSSSVSLSPAKPPHPWLLCVSFYQYVLTFSLFFLRGGWAVGTSLASCT